MLSNLKLSQKGLILVVIPLLFQLAVFYVLKTQLDQAEQERQQERVYKEKKSHLARSHALSSATWVGSPSMA